MRPQGYPARLRLKQRRDFLRVQQGGHKHHVQHFLVFVAPRSDDRPAPRSHETAPRSDGPAPRSHETAPRSHEAAPRSDEPAPRGNESLAPPHAAEAEPLPTRLGITVTRKIGCAVVRNRIKRLVREAFRHQRSRLPSGLDLVWVAKQQAATLEYADVLADFELLIHRLVRRPRGGRA